MSLNDSSVVARRVVRYATKLKAKRMRTPIESTIEAITTKVITTIMEVEAVVKGTITGAETLTTITPKTGSRTNIEVNELIAIVTQVMMKFATMTITRVVCLKITSVARFTTKLKTV